MKTAEDCRRQHCHHQHHDHHPPSTSITIYHPPPNTTFITNTTPTTIPGAALLGKQMKGRAKQGDNQDKYARMQEQGALEQKVS